MMDSEELYQAQVTLLGYATHDTALSLLCVSDARSPAGLRYSTVLFPDSLVKLVGVVTIRVYLIECLVHRFGSRRQWLHGPCDIWTHRVGSMFVS